MNIELFQLLLGQIPEEEGFSGATRSCLGLDSWFGVAGGYVKYHTILLFDGGEGLGSGRKEDAGHPSFPHFLGCPWVTGVSHGGLLDSDTL